MRPGPKKPGESAAEYSARVKAMEQKFMGGGRPKTGGGGASSGGGRRDTGPGSGALAPGYRPPSKKPGGGKMIANIPMTKMKRGGMVKGKK